MPTDLTPQFIWDGQVTPKRHAGPDWIWNGLVAKGMCTLLTGHGKSAGKTTLLSMLLSRRGGGGTFAGLAVAPGKTVIISEESQEIWDDRLGRYNFGGNVCVCPQPFLGIPTPQQWQALVAQILALQEAHGLDLAVIDPLAPFVVSENNAQSMLATLLPLRALTRARMGLLFMHHPGKAETRVGLAARGSTALLGHVDISIDMRRPAGDPLTRRRRFLCLSRFTETPRQLLLELNADATDYLPVAEPEAGSDGFQAYLDAFQMVLEDAPQKLTRGDILAEWPPDFDRPGATQLKLWLGRAVERGLILREGTGRKSDPFRYWLPATEAKWRERYPFYDHFEQQQREHNWPWVSLQEKQRNSRAEDRLESDEADADDDGDDGDVDPEPA
jgi:hypothetical protein